jgi:hypothetical protein
VAWPPLKQPTHPAFTIGHRSMYILLRPATRTTQFFFIFLGWIESIHFWFYMSSCILLESCSLDMHEYLNWHNSSKIPSLDRPRQDHGCYFFRATYSHLQNIGLSFLLFTVSVHTVVSRCVWRLILRSTSISLSPSHKSATVFNTYWQAFSNSG